jgi:hypothetical protein
VSRDIPKPNPEGRAGAATTPHPKADPSNATAPSRTPPTGVPRASAPAAKPTPAPAQAAAQKGPPSPGNTRVTSNNTGRVKFDERGNAIWEWAVTTGKFGADVSTQRLKKLDSQLSLADEAPPTRNELVKENAKGVVQGYSPYDSGHLVKEPAPPKKKTDLRRLSEWLKLRNQVNQNKSSDGNDDE